MKQLCITAVVVAAATGASLAGCGQLRSPGVASEAKPTEKPSKHDGRGSSIPKTERDRDAILSGVTEDETASIGFDLARAMRKKDLPKCLEFFDVKGLAAKIHEKSSHADTAENDKKAFDDLPSPTRKAMEAEVQRIVENFAKQIFRGQSILPLSTEERNGATFLMFRAIKQGGAPEYYEAELKTVNGKTNVADLYFFQHNEWWSKIIRFETGDGKSLQVPIGADPTTLDPDAGLREMLAACMRNDHPEALKLYRTLPRDDRERRLFLFFLIRLTGGLTSDVFQPTVDEAKRICPDDVQINVALASAFTEQKRWNDAIDSLQKVFDKVGGDPYLIAWSAQICLDANKNGAAKEVIGKVLNWPHPDWPSTRWALTNCLNRKDYSQAVECLRVMEKEFEDGTVEQIDLKKYPDFLESTEYAEWLAGRSVREPDR